MRGDIHLLRAPRDTVGREQRGQRYAVIVQSDDVRRSTVLVAPTSTSAQPSRLRPGIELDGVPTRIIVEQTTCVDTDRLGDFAGRLAPDEMATVDTALTWVLGLR